MNKDKIREIRGKLWNDDFWAIKKLCDALLEEEPLHPDDPDYEYEWPRVDEVMPVPNVDDEYPWTKFISPKDKPSLLPCPVCGGEARQDSNEFVFCRDDDCGMMGPNFDPTGEKWNALPRREMYPPAAAFDRGVAKERQRWIDAVWAQQVHGNKDSRIDYERGRWWGLECVLSDMGVTDE